MSKHSNFVLGMWPLKIFLPIILVLLMSFRMISPVFAAGSEAHIKGEFGPLHNWPLIPLAMMLMPDGRVLAYGTTTTGIQNAKLNYAIWNPLLGTGSDAFENLPNTTNTDIFCAGQAMIPGTGHALIIGGDALVNGKRNYANSDVNIFDSTTDTLVRQPQNMAFKRWYATAVTMPNGEHVILGGRDSRLFAGTATLPATEATYSPTPEVRSASGVWRSLATATSDTAYGALGGASWFYPRAWVNPTGTIFLVAHNGSMYKLDPAGAGTLTKYKNNAPVGHSNLPAVMYAPGRVLTVRRNRAAVSIDFNGTAPVVTTTNSLIIDRQYGSLTLLADGQVWANGGSSTGNDLGGATLTTELWNPSTGIWTATATAATPRLYHSASMLLLDGSVLVGGGGAPGPIAQLNGEIYYPPYLFEKDGSGNFSPRPEITDYPTSTIGWNQNFSVQSDEVITRVTLVRAGAVTHTFNNETRFFDLAVTPGNVVSVHSPASSSVAPPGYYMLFVWNSEGVPSIAKIIQLG